MLAGGCQCGRIRYEITGEPIECTACHCEDCRRASAAPFTAWLSVRREDFRLVAGMPRTYASSPPVERTFCADCGTPLTYRHAMFEDEIDVATGSLDRPEDAPPAHHTWVSQKLAWVQPADGLAQYPRAYPEV